MGMFAPKCITNEYYCACTLHRWILGYWCSTGSMQQVADVILESRVTMHAQQCILEKLMMHGVWQETSATF